jgi:hypothetical protein
MHGTNGTDRNGRIRPFRRLSARSVYQDDKVYRYAAVIASVADLALHGVRAGVDAKSRSV